MDSFTKQVMWQALLLPDPSLGDDLWDENDELARYSYRVHGTVNDTVIVIVHKKTMEIEEMNYTRRRDEEGYQIQFDHYFGRYYSNGYRDGLQSVNLVQCSISHHHKEI